MSKFECDGPPRERTPGLTKDRERLRGKHKCACHKGAARDCRGAEAMKLKACCECTGYTESVVFALYTRHPKGTLSCTGSATDTLLCVPEETTHPVLHAAIELGDILSEKK